MKRYKYRLETLKKKERKKEIAMNEANREQNTAATYPLAMRTAHT
jgi:hypothetical protein